MIGERLGKWVIFKELGRGGMGRVYLAQDELSARQGAVKVLNPDLAKDIGFLQRFQREIEALSKLDHANIVHFYESGYENGHYFYVMEFVEGASLEQIVEEHGKRPWQEVLEIALQITPALRHVHDHGIIHRDLKPSNLLRTSTGLVKLTDFGIAKIFASTHLTATGGIIGTADYLSPEQAGGKTVGKRSDLYSLGCVLYMLLTGRPPFSGATYVELLHKHRYGQFDRPQRFSPDLPHEMDELLCQLLEKDPDKRPRDALVFLRQLESIQTRFQRQSAKTSVDNRDISTRAENRTDKVGMDAVPGPATLMSRLVRAELDADQRGGLVGRFFNRPTVLILLLVACLAILVRGFWPLGQDELYARGAKLMESENVYDMQRAWTEYLDPLEARFPDHPHQDALAGFRQKWEAAKTPRLSEAQRFFQQGELLLKQGNLAAAGRVWRSLIDVFDGAPAEKEWVERAARSLADLEKTRSALDQFKQVRAALRRAQSLREQGRNDEAERIWSGLQRLYADDPAAEQILREVQKARGN